MAILLNLADRINFSKEDIDILEHLDLDLLDASIKFLKKYNKVKWTGLNKENKIKVNGKVSYKEQPLPIYPKELLRIRNIFFPEGDYKYLCVNFADGALLPSLMSPLEIYQLILDAYQRDPFCDGLFGYCVEDNLYLSMLLRLKEMHTLYLIKKSKSKKD